MVVNDSDYYPFSLGLLAEPQDLSKLIFFSTVALICFLVDCPCPPEWKLHEGKDCVDHDPLGVWDSASN